ncbi:hypothetical protein [Haliscomenobacter hydrossis]|uniref:hypothetical protein n=1 Tax=Haliscomenobacter hydrossis TaxID=2350 RepID=UPI0002EE873B|nr:hypothetical protein [Haliscomenobacter hydrossis]
MQCYQRLDAHIAYRFNKQKLAGKVSLDEPDQPEPGGVCDVCGVRWWWGGSGVEGDGGFLRLEKLFLHLKKI